MKNRILLSLLLLVSFSAKGWEFYTPWEINIKFCEDPLESIGISAEDEDNIPIEIYTTLYINKPVVALSFCKPHNKNISERFLSLSFRQGDYDINNCTYGSLCIMEIHFDDTFLADAKGPRLDTYFPQILDYAGPWSSIYDGMYENRFFNPHYEGIFYSPTIDSIIIPFDTGYLNMEYYMLIELHQQNSVNSIPSDPNANAEYYNLQGQKTSSFQNKGEIIIRKQGVKADKILTK